MHNLPRFWESVGNFEYRGQRWRWSSTWTAGGTRGYLARTLASCITVTAMGTHSVTGLAEWFGRASWPTASFFVCLWITLSKPCGFAVQCYLWDRCWRYPCQKETVSIWPASSFKSGQLVINFSLTFPETAVFCQKDFSGLHAYKPLTWLFYRNWLWVLDLSRPRLVALSGLSLTDGFVQTAVRRPDRGIYASLGIGETVG